MKVNFYRTAASVPPFPVLVGLGYWFKKETPSTFSKMLHSLRLLANDPCLASSLFLVVDDLSPIPVADRLIIEATSPRPLVIAHLFENQGSGGKDNILQAVGRKLADYTLEVDADIKLLDSMKPIFNCFREKKDAGVVTINSGFCGYQTEKANPEAEYVRSRSIGNCRCYPSAVLREAGLSDWRWRRFADIDQLSKIEWKGYTPYMAMRSHATSIASGSGCDEEAMRRNAIGVREANPLVRVHNRKDGLPIFRMTISRRPMIAMLPQIVGPSPTAVELLETVERKLG